MAGKRIAPNDQVLVTRVTIYYDNGTVLGTRVYTGTRNGAGSYISTHCKPFRTFVNRSYRVVHPGKYAVKEQVYVTFPPGETIRYPDPDVVPTV